MKLFSSMPKVAVVVLLAGCLPAALAIGLHLRFNDARILLEPVHEAMEIAGACFALMVALLISLRLRNDATVPHLIWIVLALATMGIVDGLHGVATFGPSWSWLRHGATLFGGAFFALVWIPHPERIARRRRTWVPAAVALAVVVSLAAWLSPGSLPAPWRTDGGYTLPVIAANAFGGLGFLASAVFFLRRYARLRKAEDIVFAAHAFLFGTASLLWGFSEIWAPDWWVWHVARLAAYVIVLAAAFTIVKNLYRESIERADRLAASTADLAAANRKLQEGIAERARLELYVRQAQKAEALGTLAGGIAHDLNNLLSPIFINAEMALLDAPPESPLRPNLATILQAAQRSKDLVKQIITYSRQREKEHQPLRLEPLVHEAVRFLHSTLPATIEIRVEISPGTAFVLADPTQINQVIINLCGNAAHAMRDNGGVLRLTLSEVDFGEGKALPHPGLKPGRYVRLTVEDSGVGMTAEVMERAFDPFFTTKRPGEGTGMGLALVHSIVRDCGGAITVQSQLGSGSAFRVFLPRIEALEQGPMDDPAPLAKGRGRVLLVDDEITQIESIRTVLERLGYSVVAETAGRAALSRFAANPDAFDLVITDQTMPGMTGLELAEQALRIRRQTPIILCTGYSEIIDAEGARSRGIRRFLMKPFSLKELSAAVQEALNAAAGPAGSR